MEENEMRMLEAAGGNREKKPIEYASGTVFARLDKIRKEQGDEIPKPKVRALRWFQFSWNISITLW